MYITEFKGEEATYVLFSTYVYFMATLTFGTSFFGTKFDWVLLLTLAVPSDLITENM
jgi:hypothetical protein